MIYCTHCLYPTTKPNLWLDDTGKCSACLAYDERTKIDWEEREKQFHQLNMRSSQQYDCIVAVSGGKDSHYQVIKLVELGIRPLAVCATTDHLSDLGRRNLDNIANMCDLIEVTPDRFVRRHLSRHALETVGDISWCEHVLIWTVPLREAIARSIPYVVYGECPQNEYGSGPKDSQQLSEMHYGWEHEFGGMLGLRVSDMQAQCAPFDEMAFSPYRLSVSLNTCMPMRIFLGYYFQWDGQRNAKVAEAHGFRPHTSMVEGTGCTYENLDNLQTGIHDYFRYIKYGYGRATDIVSSNIRRGRVARSAGVGMVRAFDGGAPKTYLGVNLIDILDHAGIEMKSFLELVTKFTNRNLFSVSSKTWPEPRFEVS